MQHTCEFENKHEDFDTNSLQSSAALTVSVVLCYKVTEVLKQFSGTSLFPVFRLIISRPQHGEQSGLRSTVLNYFFIVL